MAVFAAAAEARRADRRMPVALGVVALVAILGTAGLLVSTPRAGGAMKEAVDMVNPAEMERVSKFMMHNLNCLAPTPGIGYHDACVKAYKCCTGPSLNCVPEMADFYGDQCRACLEAQAPDDMKKGSLKRKFAATCWVQVVDECREVCPRHEASGQDGHAFCLSCLVTAAERVKRWDQTLEEAEKAKHKDMTARAQAWQAQRRQEKMLEAEARAAAEQNRNPTAAELRRAVEGPKGLTKPVVSEALKAKERAAILARKQALRAHVKSEEEQVEDAQETYNALESSLKDKLKAGDTKAAADLEKEANKLSTDIKRMVKGVA